MPTTSQMQEGVSYQEGTVREHTLPPYGEIVPPPGYTTFPPPSHLPPPPPPQPPGSQNIQCPPMPTYQPPTLTQNHSTQGKTKWKSGSKQSVQRHNYAQHQVPQIPPPQMFFNTYPNAAAYPDPRGQLMPPYDPYYYATQHQHYYNGNYPSGNFYANGYRPPTLQPHPPPPPPPRPYVTITQFNYQPMGHSNQHPSSQTSSQQPSQHSQPSAHSNLVFGPPPRDSRDRRCLNVNDSQYNKHLHSSTQYEADKEPSTAREPITARESLTVRSHKTHDQPKVLFHKNVMNNPSREDKKSQKLDTKSESSENFEFTIQLEQIVKSLCDEKELECLQCRNAVESNKIEEETIAATNLLGSPRQSWTESEFMNPMRIEDDELTKYIVEGCLKAESIAIRNQHRPCFKNIKHLCTRTRTDILKPRTTVANIHSQGIPWATKDFIFAFVRLINCWYILKGYLDDHDGSLGKIENALIPEFKECYQKWQSSNKDMVKHLIGIFVNLDNGITVQNAEIFSTYNHVTGNILAGMKCPPPADIPVNDSQSKQGSSKSCPKFTQEQDFQYRNSKLQSQSEIFIESIFKETEPKSHIPEPSIEDKIKNSHLEGSANVPGILRIKEVFKNTSSATKKAKADEDTDSEKECRHHKIYMKPGSYRVPKKIHSSPNISPRSIDKDMLSEHTSSPSTPQTKKSMYMLTVSDVKNNMNKHAQHNKTSNSETGNNSDRDDLWRNALETIGPFIRTVMKDSESTYDSACNDSPTKTCQSNDSSDKICVSETVSETKTFQNTKDTQAWVNDHDFENYMDENIEEIPDAMKPVKLEKRPILNKHAGAGKKNHVTSRTYRKRNDDEVSKGPKKDSGEMNQDRTFFKKNDSNHSHQTQSVTSMCFLSRRRLGLSPVTIGKFEKIIQALWSLQFAKYITFEVNAENVPDYYKHTPKPMFLCKVMNNLKQNKYSHPNQVVHDLRSIVRNSELYVQKRPDWWFEKCLTAFSKELESQLAENFSSIDFSHVTGDPSQSPNFEAMGEKSTSALTPVTNNSKSA